ncbi:MAG: hypothetical protein KME29_09720 [Calothrix sp. FI2-JRJ7]|nr:hypothetical protein [Calothrix sp. FI2-JRJ7]
MTLNILNVKSSTSYQGMGGIDFIGSSNVPSAVPNSMVPNSMVPTLKKQNLAV